MANVQMIAPNTNTVRVNGRAYTGTTNTALTVPDFDATALEANGWVLISPAGSGATAARPARPNKGLQFYDSTVGANIVWDGLAWRNHASGAVV